MKQGIDNWLDDKIALAKKDRTDNPSNRILGMEVTDKGLDRLLDDIELTNKLRGGRHMEIRVLISCGLFGLYAFFIWIMRESFPPIPFFMITGLAVLMYGVTQLVLWRKLTDRMLADNNRAYWQGRQDMENEFNQKLRDYVSKN